MVAESDKFCKTCQACHQAKVPTHRPTGLLHPLAIPTKPWDSIGTNFIRPFLEANSFNYVCVVICQITSMVHLILVHMKLTGSELFWKYMCKIVRLHGLQSLIVSDRDLKFTS